MTLQLLPGHRHLHPSTHKVQLTYKLFLLENARNTLEQELRSFTNKAYEEVQGFLNSSFPSNVFSDLAKTLDVKCEALSKLSALLKDLTADPHVCVPPAVKNGVRTNQLQPLGVSGVSDILMTDFMKFGPMLKNSLMVSSIAKVVKVLGATLSPQQADLFLTSQPPTVQQDDTISNISSSCNSATMTTSTSCNVKPEGGDVLEQNTQPDAVIDSPVITQGCTSIAEKPEILLPPIQPIFPQASNPKPVITSPINWELEDVLQVQHQKQTSSQLLHFLRVKAKNIGALEVTVLEWNKWQDLKSVQPIMKTQSYRFRHVVTDALAPKTMHINIESQVPVFRVKRVKPGGSLVYSCVIATETELWDIGDILTEVVQGESAPSPMEDGESQHVMTEGKNSCVNIHWKTQTFQCVEAKHENNSVGAETPTITSVNIPEFQIQKFEETEVVVSHIVSPGNFYIQHADCSQKLQALVTDRWKAGNSYAEQNCIPDIGSQVMGWFPKQEQWCRAQVIKICGVSRDNATDGAGTETSIQVEVKRLDYGDTAHLSLFNVKEMDPEMASLPLQAVHVSLANVTPVNGTDWSEEAAGWFKAMVHNRMLYARLYPQGAKVTVELFLERGKLGAMRRGASLSVRLAQNGHAKHHQLQNAGLVKRSTAQLKLQQQHSDWEKYLISCYTRTKKSPR